MVEKQTTKWASMKGGATKWTSYIVESQSKVIEGKHP
jgi:hypothetical protein